MIGGVCLIDLRVVSADLYLVVGRGHLGLSFPFNEGEAEVDALARRERRGAGLKPAPTLFAAGARLLSHRRVCGLRAKVG